MKSAATRQRAERIVSFGCGQSVGLAELAVPRHLEASVGRQLPRARLCCCLLREQPGVWVRVPIKIVCLSV